MLEKNTILKSPIFENDRLMYDVPALLKRAQREFLLSAISNIRERKLISMKRESPM